MQSAPTPLPEATTERWRPLRLGLVNLFYYDNQELWFRDGRMLLRGNNGTGKSKVLALTLPFLLDGEVSPSRVEPDGDPGKRMEWNLLLGGAYEERLGYAWLELGRVTEGGEATYVCIGCGLKAVAGRGIADRWLFVTSQRIGRDLFLIDANDTTPTRERLTEAIGAAGSVTRRVHQHRQNVDERLFQLGTGRYRALIDLLIQLRQPQLSKRPSEERLSAAFSEALPPVDDGVVGDVAAAFHDLEQQRNELAALRETGRHIDRFLRRYRHYGQVVARRLGGELRRAHSGYEQHGRDLARAREAIDRTRREKQTAESRRDEIAGELTELRAAREELRTRAELEKLDAAERHWRSAHESAERARARQRKAEEALAERRAIRERSARESDGTRRALSEAQTAAERRAEEAGVEGDHGALLAPLALPDGADDDRLASARDQAGELARRRREAAEHVLGLVDAADRARAMLADARRILQERESVRDTAADRRAQAETQVAEAGRALVAAWRAYARELRELALPEDDAWLDELAAWAETLEGESPARIALRRRVAERERRLAAERAAADAERERVQLQLDALRSERARLESGETRHPPAPHTRAEGIRADREGAPLWQVTDFAPELDAPTRAAIEAALEASGLLDAWLAPDGRLLDPDTHDVLVTAGAPAAVNLSRVLIPAIDPADPQAAALSPERVGAVLSAIGYGDSSTPAWIDTRGRWAVGPLHGAWSKPAAEYVGRGAREEARRRRLEELAREITATEVTLNAALRAVSRVEARQHALALEQERAPGEDAVRRAHGELASAIRDLERAQAAVRAHDPVVTAAEDAVATAERERDEAAADVRVPNEAGELRALLARIERYREAVTELVSSARVHVVRLASLATAEAECRRAEQDLAEASTEAREAGQIEREARSRLDAIRASLGATVDEIRRRLEEVTARLGSREAESKQLGERFLALVDELARTEEREAGLAARQRESAEQRDAAVDRLRHFATTGLLALAVPEIEVPSLDAAWAAEPSVHLARRVEQALVAVDADDGAWRRIREELTRRYTELAEALTPHGQHVQLDSGDWLRVSIRFQGQERSPEALSQQLAGDIEHRERLLTERERELLEEHLIGDVASHLQELISEAEQQVEHMNAELAERPTSTGMRLRLRWIPRPDAPAGLPEARERLLRQQTDLWSPEDRAAVRDFLHRQIEAERNADVHATWQEHLRRALDYRAWHAFTIERYQEGRWRPATGPASGGERVLTATLPLFAAASAHYRSAHRNAPRLVLLDEAFAGVDDDARAKCLGLLASFDLDVVMTSEREWGFYATVPGIATHQLVRREGIDAVHVTTWEWDGRARSQVERVVASRAASRDEEPAGTDRRVQESLL